MPRKCNTWCTRETGPPGGGKCISSLADKSSVLPSEVVVKKLLKPESLPVFEAPFGGGSDLTTVDVTLLGDDLMAPRLNSCGSAWASDKLLVLPVRLLEKVDHKQIIHCRLNFSWSLIGVAQGKSGRGRRNIKYLASISFMTRTLQGLGLCGTVAPFPQFLGSATEFSSSYFLTTFKWYKK